MNILFRGGGFSNKGDEAMMLTVQRELARRLPRANFFLSTSRASAEMAHSSGLLPFISRGGPLSRAWRLAATCVTKKDVRRVSRVSKLAGETLAHLKHVDCVVDISGFNYSDAWGASRAQRGLAWAGYCRDHDRPYVCMPQAWGPFRQSRLADAVRRLCGGASSLYARDEVSLSLLRELLGPAGKDVSLAPDIVFLFAGESPTAGRKVLESLGVDTESGPLVGIAPNMRVYQRCRGVGAANEYIQLMIQVAEHCIQTWGASAILVPHEFSLRNVAQQDDRSLCGLIKVGVSQSERCFTLREYASAPIIKSIEAQLDFMIGSRFHSCVFALSSGVPAVALGWAHKYPELMKLVGLDGNALIHTDFAEARVRGLLDEAWKVRAQSKATIREHLPEIRRQVKKVFDDTAELLRAIDGESTC